MAKNSQQNQRIDYLNIDFESNYFNTKEQIKLNQTIWFKDTSVARLVSGTNSVTGLFSRNRIVKDDYVYNSPVYSTGSTVIDDSGSPRKILSLDIDYFSSSSVDAYKNGVELTRESHWTAGSVKISAGTPGHLYETAEYGYSSLSVVAKDRYEEIEVFDPVRYVETGGDPKKFIYPIVTSDYNQLENYTLNGIIEPFPIRSVISNYSINFPFEPHAFRGQFGNGNTNSNYASDVVTSLDYFAPNIANNSPYLDAVDMVAISTSGDGGTMQIGSPIGYFTTDVNHVLPFEDAKQPRNQSYSLTDYEVDMIQALSGMSLTTDTYVNRKQKSATTGFIYENCAAGVDSITYGDLLY
jgi:hypothetical protein